MSFYESACHTLEDLQDRIEQFAISFCIMQYFDLATIFYRSYRYRIFTTSAQLFHCRSAEDFHSVWGVVKSEVTETCTNEAWNAIQRTLKVHLRSVVVRSSIVVLSVSFNDD